jgi:hypothetical protein
MEFVRDEGSRGNLKVVATDVASDLPLLKMAGETLGYLRLHRDKLATGDPWG